MASLDQKAYTHLGKKFSKWVTLYFIVNHKVSVHVYVTGHENKLNPLNLSVRINEKPC